MTKKVIEEKSKLKDGIEKVLKDNNVYPVSEPIWKSLYVNHAKKTNEKTAEGVRRKINESIGERKKGIYVYKKEESGKVLYVGSGWLPDRIRQHYNESYRESSPNNKGIDWYTFFQLGSNQGQLKVFWKILDEKLNEKDASNTGRLLEYMLAYVLEPSFKHFRKIEREKRASR